MLAEAERLYCVGGYDAISLQAIANHLAISKAALFYHFDSKQTLFFAVLHAILDRMQRELHAPDKGRQVNVRARLLAMMRAMTTPPVFDVARFLRSELALLTPQQQHVLRQTCDAKLFANIRAAFDDGIASGTLRAHDSNVSAMVFQGVCNAVSLLDAVPMPAAARTQHAEQALDMLLAGLSAN
jgi:AcrR family transcriptional regulator